MIGQGHELDAPFARSVDTVIVGSGAGGAPVAAILAEAGVEVLVLEEGGYFTARDFTQRDDEMLPALYRDGANQLTSDGVISVLQGSCFGGSTVINAADCEPTPPAVYAHWKRVAGLTQIDERTLEASERRVLETLRVNEIPRAEVNRNNAIVLEGAQKLGLAAGVFRHNRVGCQGSGYCMIGCAYDAKKGAHLTWLPRAVAAGADVQTDARVERIMLRAATDERRFVLHGAIIERGTRIARFPLRIEARRVVLAAGAVHTPAILHASGFGRGLPQLGENVSLQPQLAVTALFPGAGSVRAWRGIPQSAFCSAHDHHTAEHGLGGFRVEGLSVGLSQLGAMAPGFGLAHKQAMARVDRTAAALLLVPDQPSGRMCFEHRPPGGFRVRIDYSMKREWLGRLRRGMRNAAEIYFAAGAEQVSFASEIFEPLRSGDALDRIEHFAVRTGVTRFISAHVQGSCRMSPDAARGVVDENHQVHGIPGLYVVDASVMPTTASTHTMIPVMTLADRAAHRMLEA